MSLTPDELSKFKEKLLEMRDSIGRQLGESKKEVTFGTDSTAFKSQHPADSGTEVAMQTANLSVSNVETAMLRQIEHALERIKEKTYGICEDTGEKIPIQRLEAFPLATRTARAQEKFEKEQKYKAEFQ